MSEEQKNTQVPSLDRLMPYKEKIEMLLADYGDSLIPHLVEYEVELSCFPVEVLNEIRAIYAHLYRASVSDDDKDIGGNIEKALSHSKRASLDCYKYLCVAYDERFHAFFKRYNYVNWGKSKLLGEIDRINSLRGEAVSLLRDAKEMESKEDKSQITSYDQKYKLAYEKYCELSTEVKKLEHWICENPDTIVSRIPGFLLAVVATCGVLLGVLLGVAL